MKNFITKLHLQLIFLLSCAIMSSECAYAATKPIKQIESQNIQANSNNNFIAPDQFNNIDAIDQDQSKMSYIKRQIELSKLQQQLNKENGVTSNTVNNDDIHVIGVMLGQNGNNLAQIKLHNGTVINVTIGDSFNRMQVKSITMDGVNVIYPDCKTKGCKKTEFYPVTPLDDIDVKKVPNPRTNPFVNDTTNLAVPPIINN